MSYVIWPLIITLSCVLGCCIHLILQNQKDQKERSRLTDERHVTLSQKCLMQWDEHLKLKIVSEQRYEAFKNMFSTLGNKDLVERSEIDKLFGICTKLDTHIQAVDTELTTAKKQIFDIFDDQVGNLRNKVRDLETVCGEISIDLKESFKDLQESSVMNAKAIGNVNKNCDSALDLIHGFKVDQARTKKISLEIPIVRVRMMKPRKKKLDKTSPLPPPRRRSSKHSMLARANEYSQRISN